MTTQAIKVAIVGAHFRPPAKVILAHLPARCALRIRPEPTNPYDEWALQVLVASADIPQSEHEELGQEAQFFGHSIESILASDEWHLGYIPKTEAVHLQPRIVRAIEDRNGYAEQMDQRQIDSHWFGTLAFDPAGKPQVQFDLPTKGD